MFGLFGGRSKQASALAALEAERSALEKSHILIRYGLDGTIQDVNEAFTRALGFSSGDVVDRPHAMLLRQKDKMNPDQAKIWSTVAQGEFVNGIYPWQNANGEEVWVDVSFAPVLGESGVPNHVMGLARVITRNHILRRDNRGQVDAVRRTMAVIEFDLQGNILTANDLFLKAMGYRMDEIKGKHHRMFVPPDQAGSLEYSRMWEGLAQGTNISAEVKRISKSGETRWLQATYSTVLDPEDRPFKVVKYAFDITEAKNLAADAAGQISAIQKVQAVIEFDTEGRILNANQNFCDALGYTAEELVGKHHRMFVAPQYSQSPEYATFWSDLRQGKVQKGEFSRIGKGGREVWIRASYNPIYNADGKVSKVVKFAVDTTFLRRAATAMERCLKKLAEGDLTVEIADDLGELDVIRVHFNNSVGKMRQILDEVVGHSATIQSETRQITHASEDLAKRTEHQAATLEEAAAAIDEMNAALKTAADTAAQARGMVSDAKASAERSGEVVRDATQAMDEIAESSKKISSITGVIDEIAFQTNLLALNAGVEAARAGEAGRGFAVVASEVRALAQRSSDAAREIADLIGASTIQVERGVSLVGQAGDVLKTIHVSVGDIHERVVEIAASAQEQAVGLSEVSAAINQLDQATQQNAAMFEETHAATQSLMGETNEMQASVSFFQLGGSGESMPYPRGSTRAA